MAIINAKRLEADEEAERQARARAEDYALRHDTAWQQPPPAYEESAASASSSSAAAAAAAVEQEQYQARSSDFVRSSNTSPSHPQRNTATDNAPHQHNTYRSIDADEESQESMPLLTNHQRRKVKRSLIYLKMCRRACKIVSVAFLLALAIVFLLRISGITNPKAPKSAKQPTPDHSDGVAIEDPVWSKTVKTPQDTWFSPDHPMYASTAWFTFAANNSLHFLHAQGTSYHGWVRYAASDELEQDEWKRIHKGQTLDRIAVSVRAEFTHESVRDYIRVNKMRRRGSGKDVAEGIGIYGGNDALPVGDSFITYRVTIYLPKPSLRTATGLAYDGSSWIPHLEARLDNLRIAYEAASGPDDSNLTSNRITYGKMSMDLGNGGLSIAAAMMANQSISIKMANGLVRDFVFRIPRPFSIAAPSISINVINGPIWVSGVVGIENVSLHTVSGAINVSAIATARRISSSTTDSVMGGYYAPAERLEIRTQNSDVAVDVNLKRDLHAKIVKECGLYDLLGPEATKFDMGWADVDNKNDNHDHAGGWHEKHVDVHNKLGGLFVRYAEHDADVLLRSNLSSYAGAITVEHDIGFQGEFEIRSKIGGIFVDEPQNSTRSPPDVIASTSRPTFVAQALRKYWAAELVHRWGLKIVTGKLWLDSHHWSDGGVGKGSTFPKSTSFVKTDLGDVVARFS